MGLLSLIREEINSSEQKGISFARFMQVALYHPQSGYYTSARPKVGKSGDFYTSATVHPVFAETLADVIIDMCANNDFNRPTIVEVGGGTGYLIKHLVERITKVDPNLVQKLRLLLVEASPYHQQLQREALSSFQGEIKWYSSIEQAAKHENIEGVVFSNEWLDAFPVHLVEKTKSGWQEVWVIWDEQAECLQESVRPLLTSEVEQYLEETGLDVPVGMRIEINPGMKQAVSEVARLLTRGYAITIDYGDTEDQLYHPSRKRGTLMCYHRHQAHENPFVNIGEQDITSHVNFSALIKWGANQGLHTLALLRQDQFLLQSGILSKLENHNDRDPFTSNAMKRNRAIQQLITAGGMGGVFRVLVQAKNVPAELTLRCMQKPEFFI